ncbi:MAG: type II toxin-antitoxin system ParD family antitoxin [Sphingomonadales bacterium]|jgi:Arc/MetJ-type ribon-helix-helix transcriptional regulator
MATLTITLPDDLAETVRARVAAGDYPDEGAVIADLLRAHGEPADVTEWLRREVPARLATLGDGAQTLLGTDAVRMQLAEWRANRR